jgi:hypothetical protein
MVVVHLRTHVAHARLAHGCSTARAHGAWGGDPCRATGTGHMCRMGSLNRLAIVHLGHATDPSTSQSWVLVAVAPAVDCALDQSSLSAQAGVELRQGPSDRVALRLVLQPIAAVLVLRAASTRVHAVLVLELS